METNWQWQDQNYERHKAAEAGSIGFNYNTM